MSNDDNPYTDLELIEAPKWAATLIARIGKLGEAPSDRAVLRRIINRLVASVRAGQERATGRAPGDSE